MRRTWFTPRGLKDNTDRSQGMPIRYPEKARQLVEGIRKTVAKRRSEIKVVDCSVVNDRQEGGQYLKVHFRRLGTGPGELTETVFLNISDPIPATLTALGQFMDTPSVLERGTPASGKIQGERVRVGRRNISAAMRI